MTSVQSNPKIYHITHWRNLEQIVRSGGLWSDAKRIELQLNNKVVGLSGIKENRLKRLSVKCHPTTKVGEYVPFYFCPRSIMLYIFHMDNHPELSYHEGQEPIVHLVSDVRTAVAWADSNSRRWAFSDRNAGVRYASFFKQLTDLSRVNWSAVANNDFRDLLVKDGKQAEFLVHEFFPWELVERIGVASKRVEAIVNGILTSAGDGHHVTIEKMWYF